jgi:hypothetical protein
MYSSMGQSSLISGNRNARIASTVGGSQHQIRLKRGTEEALTVHLAHGLGDINDGVIQFGRVLEVGVT